MYILEREQQRFMTRSKIAPGALPTQKRMDIVTLDPVLIGGVLVIRDQTSDRARPASWRPIQTDKIILWSSPTSPTTLGKQVSGHLVENLLMCKHFKSLRWLNKRPTQPGESSSSATVSEPQFIEKLVIKKECQGNTL